VSFDLPVARYYQSITGALPGASLAQTTMRPRDLVDTTIRVYCLQNKGTWTTDPETLKKLLNGFATATENAIFASDFHWTYSPVQKRMEISNTWFLDSYICLERQKREAKNDLVRSYVGHVTRHGFEVIDLRDEEVDDEILKDMKERRNAIKAEIKAETIKMIAEAEIIEEEELEAILSAPTKTLEESASIEKHLINDFYGREVTPELVDLDRDGRTRRVCKDYVLTSLYSKGIKQAAALLDRADVHGLTVVKTQKESCEFKNYTIKAKLANQLIRQVCGVGIHRIDGVSLTASALRAALEPLVANAGWRFLIQETFGISTNDKTLENPIKWFLRFLARFGVTSKSCRPRKSKKDPNAVRERVYTLSSEQVKDLSSHNQAKVIDMVLEARKEMPEWAQNEEWHSALYNSLGENLLPLAA